MTVLAYSDNLGKVNEKTVSGHLLIGYDDLYAIQYFNDNRMAYWKHNGQTDIFDAFAKGQKEYAGMMKRCADFDGRLMQETAAAGGQKYAELCALAYRQAISATCYSCRKRISATVRSGRSISPTLRHRCSYAITPSS